MNSVDASNRQATLLCAIDTSILVFSGLFVAGVLALLASEQFDKFGFWKVTCASISLILAFGSGLSSITSMMYAHNMARRSERKDASDPKVTDADIDRARKVSVFLALVGMFGAAAAALSISIVVFIIVREKIIAPVAQPQSKITTIQVGDASAPLHVKAADATVKITNLNDHCDVEIVASGTVVTIGAEASCGLQAKKSTGKSQDKHTYKSQKK